MGYDFMASNSAGALQDRSTLICEANEGPSWLSIHYAQGASPWAGEKEEKLVCAVKAA